MEDAANNELQDSPHSSMEDIYIRNSVDQQLELAKSLMHDELRKASKIAEKNELLEDIIHEKDIELEDLRKQLAKLTRNQRTKAERYKSIVKDLDSNQQKIIDEYDKSKASNQIIQEAQGQEIEQLRESVILLESKNGSKPERLQEELEYNKAVIEDQRKQIFSFKTESLIAKKETKQLLTIISQLEDQLKECKEQGQLAEELTKGKEKINMLRKENSLLISQVRSTRMEAKKTAKRMRTEGLRMEEELAEQKSAQSSIQKDLQQKILTLAGETQSQHEQIQDLLSQQKTHLSDISSLKKKLAINGKRPEMTQLLSNQEAFFEEKYQKQQQMLDEQNQNFDQIMSQKEDQLNEAQSDIINQQKKIREIREENSQLRQGQENNSQQVLELQEQLSLAVTENQKQQKDIVHLTESLQTFSTTKQDHLVAITLLAVELERNQLTIDRFHTELSAIKEEKDGLQLKTEQLLEDLEKQNGEIQASYEVERGEIVRKLEELQERDGRLEFERNSLKNQLDSIRIKQGEDQKDEYYKIVINQDKKLLQETIQKHDSEKSELLQSVKALKSELEDLKTSLLRLSVLEKSARELVLENDRLNQQLISKEAFYLKLCQSNTETHNRFLASDTLSEEITVLETQVKDLLSENDQFSKEIALLKRENQEQDTKISELIALMDSIGDRFEETKAENRSLREKINEGILLDSKIKQIESKVMVLTEDNENLEQRLSDQKSDSTKKQSELQQRDTRILELFTKLNEFRLRFSEKERELFLLQQNITSMQSNHVQENIHRMQSNQSDQLVLKKKIQDLVQQLQIMRSNSQSKGYYFESQVSPRPDVSEF